MDLEVEGSSRSSPSKKGKLQELENVKNARLSTKLRKEPQKGRRKKMKREQT